MPQSFTIIKDAMRWLNVAVSGAPYVIPAADNEPERQTYGASILGLSLAATPTDVFLMQGPIGKIARIKSITLNGLSASLAAYPVSLIRRSADDTGGTRAAMTPFKHDTSDPNSGSGLWTYTANPSGLGAQVGGAHAGRVVAATASNLDRVAFQYAWQNDKAIVLNGAGEFLAINLGGVALAGATSLDIDILWTEEG